MFLAFFSFLGSICYPLIDDVDVVAAFRVR